ncbi:hypothetical protein [Novosphingobium sp.]|uniref:hypothetical protein n=1 Tax=Novosphingobium sp. TaxID=1874826 RepID=UPI0035AEE7F0
MAQLTHQPTRSDIYDAIRAADAAGDGDAVRTLGEYLKTLPPAPQSGSRTVTVTLKDGSQTVYQNAPDDISPEQAMARAKRDGGNGVTINGGGKNSSTVFVQPDNQCVVMARDGARLTFPCKATFNMIDRFVTAYNAQIRPMTIVPVSQPDGMVPNWLSNNVPGAIGLALLLFLALTVRAISRSGLGPRLMSAWTSSKGYRGLRPHLASIRFLAFLGLGVFFISGGFYWRRGVEIHLPDMISGGYPLYVFPQQPFAVAFGAMLLAAAWLYRPARVGSANQH